jgi:ribosomal peptide maturation radical SAM protein 1
VTPSVVLVSTPFAPFERPSPQLGILKALLAEKGIDAEDRYLTIDFFESLYEEGLGAHYSSSTAALIAEWYFSERPFDPKPGGRDFFASFRLKEYARAGNLRWEDMVRIRTELAPAFLERAASEGWKGTQVLCFTLSFPQIMASVGLARRIKKRNPAITTIFGGAYTQLHDRSAGELMRLYPFIDCIILGDGEPVFADVVGSVLKGDGIPELPGVFSHRGEEIRYPDGVSIFKDFNNYPIPDYGGFFERAARLPRGAAACLERVIPLEISRGCPWSRKKPCSFCAFSPHQVYAVKPSRAAVDEMISQSKRYGVKGFYSLDTALPAALIDEVLVPARQADPALHLTFLEVRADLPRKTLEILGESGTGLIQPGIEGLDDALLRKMAKGVTLAQNLLFLKTCREVGLRLSWNLILGIPDASPEDVERQLRLIPLLHHLEPPYPMPLAYVRFSSYWREDLENGRLGLQPEPFYGSIYPDGADISALAFEHVACNRGSVPASLYRDTADAIMAWRKLWQGGRPPFLHFVRHGEGAMIVDARSPGGPERHLLDRPAASVYEACMEEAVERDSLDCEPDDFVHRGLMVEIDGKYLSLATRPGKEAPDG